jgi:hypothetical protein
LSTRRAQSYQKSDSRSTQMNLFIDSLSSFVSPPYASVSKMDTPSYDHQRISLSIPSSGVFYYSNSLL